MNNCLNFRVDWEHFKLVFVNISLTLFQRTRCLFATFCVNAVASRNTIHTDPRNLDAVNIGFNVCCKRFNWILKGLKIRIISDVGVVMAIYYLFPVWILRRLLLFCLVVICKCLFGSLRGTPHCFQVFWSLKFKHFNIISRVNWASNKLILDTAAHFTLNNNNNNHYSRHAQA